MSLDAREKDLWYPKFLERQWQFFSCKFGKPKLLFLFFMNPLSPLITPSSVHVSPSKGRKNSRFKPSVLVSYNLKSKRDKNIKWRIPRIKLHVINVQPTSVNTILHRFHYRFGNRQYWLKLFGNRKIDCGHLFTIYRNAISLLFYSLGLFIMLSCPCLFFAIAIVMMLP